MKIFVNRQKFKVSWCGFPQFHWYWHIFLPLIPLKFHYLCLQLLNRFFFLSNLSDCLQRVFFHFLPRSPSLQIQRNKCCSLAQSFLIYKYEQKVRETVIIFSYNSFISGKLVFIQRLLYLLVEFIQPFCLDLVNYLLPWLMIRQFPQALNECIFLFPLMRVDFISLLFLLNLSLSSMNSLPFCHQRVFVRKGNPSITCSTVGYTSYPGGSHIHFIALHNYCLCIIPYTFIIVIVYINAPIHLQTLTEIIPSSSGTNPTRVRQWGIPATLVAGGLTYQYPYCKQIHLFNVVAWREVWKKLFHFR
eukprot:TRINITY_DN3419_c0_g1_i3.p1 TRINITY_DN3419_c0_g1~~TRINITY_DN3419_c0_g1_i3.p1  ORF type:complete len:325 (+),score=-42.09 TRINITY_DN3419_c0_g1_i3:67-975(+)